MPAADWSGAVRGKEWTMIALRNSVVLLACMAIVAGACSSSPAPINLSPETGPVTLSPGDSIRINVWRYEEFSGQFGIGADGSIAHPLYQEVDAANVPLSNLDAAITDVLREYVEQPEMVVEPLFVVVIVGDVIAPGTYAMPPSTTLVQAVARAGGPSLDAKASNTKLLRTEENGTIITQELDLTDPTNIAFRATVRSGDQFIVPAKTFTTGLWIALIGATAAVLLVIERFTRD